MDTQAAVTIRDSSACGEVRVLDHDLSKCRNMGIFPYSI